MNERKKTAISHNEFHIEVEMFCKYLYDFPSCIWKMQMFYGILRFPMHGRSEEKVFDLAEININRQKLIPQKLRSDGFKLNMFGFVYRFFSSIFFIAFGKLGLMNVSPLVICSFFSLPLFFPCSAFYMTWSEWELNAIIRFVWLNELVRV